MLASFIATSLLVSSSAFAYPALFRRAGCSVEGITVDIPAGQTAISQSSLPVTGVSVGFGTQNYTCADTGKFV